MFNQQENSNPNKQ